MKIKPAQEIALQIVTKLQPFCDKIYIAGSIRREKEFVKDIEIICLPKLIVTKDLFGNSIPDSTTNIDFYKTVRSLGEVNRGKDGGRYMKVDLHEGIALDLFTPTPTDFYRQLAIRTGPSEYSENVIAVGWRKKGWVGTAQGLRRETECIYTGKWKCVVPDPELPPIWISEEHFFEWIGHPFKLPKERSRYIVP